jgi:Holliday junction resolvase|tara:strand:- start:1106 stop:1480 length:375 start_codon:yes stop_codon:yes gene_type:complete
VKPETKFWHELKKRTRSISWIRIENLSVPGTPDLLGYNNYGTFFTLELKFTKTNKVKFSPHQIAFHVKHPENTFVLIKQETASLKAVKLFRGSRVQKLAAWGLTLEPCFSDYDSSIEFLETLGA